MKYEMTTKTSPPATVVKIKKEIASDEIKDFAETAMNELLGWYGYDNVERIDLSAKPSRLMISALNSSEKHNLNGSRNSIREDSTTPDHDSSREDSKSPSSTKNSEKQETHCGWCRRLVPQNSPEFLTTPDGPRYCSESCFAQSRRASFKRAKTCDWCRHVRHAVSYVDFQDGASQLQFCSDKCLNQYKMQLFCKETQAHLDMNPHLKEKGVDASGGLITPDLWLKNCRSRSASPASELSRSPTPTQSVPPPPATPHKPIITVAPASKLLSRNVSNMTSSSRRSPKHGRKKRLARLNLTQNSNSSSSSLISPVSNHTNHHNNKSKILANSLTSASHHPKPCTFTSVQDLRLNVPQMSPIEGSHTIRPNLPPSFFSSPPPNAFSVRPNFFPNFPHPRLLGVPHHPQIPTMPPTDISGLSSVLGAAPPPVTVMVPYPIIVPLPIPIPIPLPIIDFIKAAELRKSDSNNSQNKPEENSNQQQQDEEINEPLDFTKSKEPQSTSIVTNVVNADKESSPSVEEHATTIGDYSENSNEKEKLPKIVITRLNARRNIAAIRESENSRPLRKRKRIIDSDYIRSCQNDEDIAKQKK